MCPPEKLEKRRVSPSRKFAICENSPAPSSAISVSPAKFQDFRTMRSIRGARGIDWHFAISRAISDLLRNHDDAVTQRCGALAHRRRRKSGQNGFLAERARVRWIYLDSQAVQRSEEASRKGNWASRIGVSRAHGFGRAAMRDAMSVRRCESAISPSRRRVQHALFASRLSGIGAYVNRVRSRGVAQPGSAPALGAGGRPFKSARPDCASSSGGQSNGLLSRGSGVRIPSGAPRELVRAAMSPADI